MSDPLDAALGTSGVRVRCGDCGKESDYQRELRMPPRWSLTWRVVDGRSWPRYLCEECKVAPRGDEPKPTLAQWRERAKDRRKKR